MDLCLFIIEGVLWVVDILGVSADVYAWFKGKDNRIERREARKDGADVPVRDKWNRLVIALTVLACLLTLGLMAWKL
jgi:hypothetical protein